MSQPKDHETFIYEDTPVRDLTDDELIQILKWFFENEEEVTFKEFKECVKALPAFVWDYDHDDIYSLFSCQKNDSSRVRMDDLLMKSFTWEYSERGEQTWSSVESRWTDFLKQGIQRPSAMDRTTTNELFGSLEEMRKNL